jgi:hypothetical protein
MALDSTYLQVSDGTGDASLMTVTATRAIGSTVIDVDTVVGVPAKFIATSGTLDANGFITAASKVDFYGSVSGSTLVIAGYCPGSTDAGNSIGQKVAIKPNTSWADLVADAFNAWSVWVPNPTGYTGSVTLNIARYSQIGKTVRLEIDFSGVSNATTLTFTLPVAAKDAANFGPHRTQDNGITGYTGLITLVAGSVNATVTNTAVGGPFTASGAKGLYTRFFYEAA